MKTYDNRSAGASSGHKFCLITAKADELREVKVKFDSQFDREDDDGDGSPTVYTIKRPRSREPITVLVTCCKAMGHVHAASKTAQITSRHRPSILLFVGTAASLDSHTTRLGDVIVPSASMYLLYDKIVEKGQRAYQDAAARGDFREYFFGDCLLLKDKKTEELPGTALDFISDVDFKLMRLLPGGDLPPAYASQIERNGSVRVPIVETDSEIITCGMVVNSEIYREHLLGQASRKTAAIDMESFGFFRALRDLRDSGTYVTDGVMIRGISDYAGRKEDTELGAVNWKSISMQNASIVAASFIKQITDKRFS